VTSKVNVGVIGAGRIGRVHAQNLAFRVLGAQVSVVSDIMLDAAQQCAVACGVPEAVQDYRRILEDPAIEAVAICSSTDTHSRMIEEAAAAGKHIFCEKPIDFDLARIDRALAAVERAGVLLQIGFNRRFDPSFKRVRDLVEAGAIGQPHVLRITSRDPGPPPISYVKVSGGIFLDMTIHDFDMARYLVGSEVSEVFAVGEVLVDPEIGRAGDLDTVVITLRFENGAIGTIDNSRRAVYGYDQRVEVFGSGGAVAAGNQHPNSVVVSDMASVHRDLPLHFFIERYTEAYVAEMQAFIACVQAGQTPPVTGRDGRIPVVMGHAARRSFDERRPVKLSEIA
jgi:myo-inositol 2-dehydrogenase/D-chiro-inositol 1-dehydrogenase